MNGNDLLNSYKRNKENERNGVTAKSLLESVGVDTSNDRNDRHYAGEDNTSQAVVSPFGDKLRTSSFTNSKNPFNVNSQLLNAAINKAAYEAESKKVSPNNTDWAMEYKLSNYDPEVLKKLTGNDKLSQKEENRQYASEVYNYLKESNPEAYEYLSTASDKGATAKNMLTNITQKYADVANEAYKNSGNASYGTASGNALNMGFQAANSALANTLNAAANSIQTQTYKDLVEKYGMSPEEAAYWDKNYQQISGIISNAEAENVRNEYIANYSDEVKSAMQNYIVAKRNVEKYAGHGYTGIGTTDSGYTTKYQDSIKKLEELGVNLQDEEYALLEQYIEQNWGEIEKNFNDTATSIAVEKYPALTVPLNYNSLAFSPYSGMAATAGTFIDNAMKPDKSQPTDTNKTLWNLQNMDTLTQNVTNEAISRAAEANDHDPKYGQFAYGVGYSTAKSLYSMALGSAVASNVAPAISAELGLTGKSAEKVGSVVAQLVTLPSFGTSAYSSTLQQQLDMGVGEDKAQSYAVISGINEMLYEELSLDKAYGIYAASKAGRVSWQKAVMNVFSQAGIEGSEEVFTELANRYADAIVNCDFSQHNTKVRNYVNQGYSQEEAENMVKQEEMQELFETFLAGAASGGITGGATTIAGTVNYHSTAKNIMSDNAKVQALYDQTKASATEGSTASDIVNSKTANELTESDVANILESLNETGSESTEDFLTQAFMNRGESEEQAKQDAQLVLDISNTDLSDTLTDEEIEQRYFDNSELTDDERYKVKTANEIEQRNAAAIEANPNLANVLADYNSGKLQNPTTIAQVAMQVAKNENNAARAEKIGHFIDSAKNKVNTIADKVSGRSNSFVIGNTKSGQVGVMSFDDVSQNKAIVNTNQGKMDITDIDLGRSNEAMILKTGAEYENTKAANYLIDDYSGQDLQAYVSLSRYAYNLGQNGQPLSTLFNDKSVFIKNSLDSLQKMDQYNEHIMRMYNAGLETRSERSVEKVNAEKANAVQNKLDVAKDDKLYDFKSVIRDYTQANVLTDYAESRFNAAWITDTATLKTSANATNEYAAIVHEMFEFSRAMAPKEYEALKQAVLELAHDKLGYAEVQNVIKQYQNAYRTAGIKSEAKKTLSEATDEFVNDFMAGAFSTESGAQQFIEHVANNDKYSANEKASIFQSFADWVNHLLDTIKEFLTGKQQLGAKKALELEKMGVSLENIRDMALKAMDAAKVELNSQLTATHTQDVSDDYGESQADIIEAHSIDSYCEGLNLELWRDENNLIRMRNVVTGLEVTKVTPDMVKASPVGAILSETVKRGNITNEEYDKQVDFLVKLTNQMLDMQDIDMVWAVNSTIGYNALPMGERTKESKNRNDSKFAFYTGNADPQYSTTIDFTTICVKTQAVIDVMSETMKRLGRGLKESEIIDIVYKETHDAGEPVPCPVCYVFSRWVGLGGLFDNMNNWQEKYENASVAELQKDVDRLNKEIEAIKKRTDKTNSASKDALYKSLKKEFDDLDSLKRVGKTYDTERYAQLQKDIDTLNAWSWLKNVRLAPDYEEHGKVPPEILFDINKGKEFADEYPLAWKFRTTRGPSMGKAAVPYNDMRTGQVIRGRSLADLSKLGIMSSNPFLSKASKSGELNATARKNFTQAIKKAAAQNMLNGQRIQSTSDFRFEYALDYLMAFFELQAIGSKVQLYTKVPESVAMFATVNAEVNCSLMPLANGFEECSKNDPEAIEYEGKYYKLTFSNVTGMDARDAFNLSSRYDNVQPIMVGIGEQHIRMCLRDGRITFVIPYHASGSSENRYVAMMNAVKESVASRTDYSNYQSDREDANATETQKAAREIREKILTGNAENLSAAEKAIVEGNKYLSALYDKMYTNVSAKDRVFLTSAQAKMIMPHEYWDYSTTIDNAYVNGENFIEYCKSLGIIPRFSGYNANGVYNASFDFTNESGYWKTLIDRSMYNNDGTSHEQKAIDVTNFSLDFLQAEPSREGIYLPSQVNNESKVNAITDKVVDKIGKEAHSINVDSDGNTLSEQQIEYFKDSKARDAEGRLLTMYHGTESYGFNTFEQEDTIANANFFTDNIEVAKAYSGSSEIYAPTNIKTIDDFEKQLPESDRKRFTVEKTDSGYTLLDDGDYADDAKNLNYLYKKYLNYIGTGSSANYKAYLNAVNPYIVDGKSQDWDALTTDISGEAMTTNEVVAWARENGYDSVIFNNIVDNGLYMSSAKRNTTTSTVIAVMNSNQIKSTNNLNPTTNDDIRYSIDVGDENFNAAIQEMMDDISGGVDRLANNMSKVMDFKSDISKRMISNVAKNIKKIYGSDIKSKDLEEKLMRMFNYLRETGSINAKDIELIRTSIGEQVVDSMRADDPAAAAEYDKFVSGIKTWDIALDEGQMQEVKNKFDSYYGFKRYMAGKLSLNKNGTLLDDIWTEICDLSGGALSYGTNPNNQPIALAEYINKLEPKARILDEQSYEEASMSVALEVFRQFFNETSKKDAAEFMRDEIKEYNKAVKQRYQNLYNEALKEVEKAKAAELERLQQEYENLTIEEQAAMAEGIGELESVQIQQLKEDTKKRIDELKKQNNEAIAKVKADYRNRKLTERANRAWIDTKRKLVKEIESLQNMLAHPKEAATKHVPIHLVLSTIDLLEAIQMDTGRNKAITERLAKLASVYESYKTDLNNDDGTNYGFDYDARIAADIAEVKAMFDNGRFYTDLYTPEMERLLEIVRALKTQIKNANNLIIDGQVRDARDVALDAITEVKNSRTENKNYVTDMLDRYGNQHLNTYRIMRKLSGYTDGAMMKLYYNLEEGGMREMQIQQQLNDIFKDVLEGNKNQKEIKRFISTKPNDLVDIGIVDETGKSVKVSRAMRMSIIMHSFNENNMRHILYGGLTIPDMKVYSQNKSKAYSEYGDVYRFLDYQEYLQAVKDNDKAKQNKMLADAKKKVDALQEDLSEWEKKFLAAAKKMFHEETGRLINDTSIALKGYTIARVKNYFPIKTDTDFTPTDFAGLVQNGTIEGMGMLKERVTSKKPMMLEDITDVIQRQIRNTSKYAAYAIPVRNFKMAMRQTFKDNRGEGTTLEKNIRKVWNAQNVDNLRNMLTAIETGKGRGEETFKVLNKIRANFAGAVLSINPSVAIKQAASYPTAAAVVGYLPLIQAVKDMPKGFAQAKGIEELEKRNPLLWYRAQGYGSQDLADAKASALINKLPTKLQKALGWTQFMDTGTVRTLEYAAKHYVDNNFKSLEKGSDAYWNKVSEVFTQVVTETQPNYDTLHKATIIRDGDSLAKMLVMFKTQPMQNFGILYDALGELDANINRYNSSKSDANKAKVKESVNKFAYAVTSQLMSAVTFSAMSIIARLLLHKIGRYRKGELEEWSWLAVLKEFGEGVVSCLTGMLLGGSEIYETATYYAGKNKYYSGIEVSSVEALNDFTTNTKYLADATTKLWEAKTTAERDEASQKVAKYSVKVGNYAGQLLGIPTGNIYNIIQSIYLYGVDAVTSVENGQLTFSSKTDVTDWEVATQYERMYDAVLNDDIDEYNKLVAEMIDTGKDESYIVGKVKSMIKDEYFSESQDRLETIENLVDIGFSEAEASHTVNQWYTGYKETNEYGPTKTLIRTAADDPSDANRKAVVEEVRNLIELGKTKDNFAKQLKQEFKDEYNEGTNKVNLNAILRQALVAAGYTDEEAAEVLAKWSK